MLIGIPKEIKNNENRVALTPAGVQSLVAQGHRVVIEKGAGLGSGFTDADYEAQGAKILPTAREVWASELVVKVKEPLAEEYGFLRKDLLLFTYLHMAAAPELADAMLASQTTGIAYETVTDNGQLPLLTPMSEVAGRMAVQIGAHFLTKQEGGSGVLLGGVPGVPKGKITIIGGGVVGTHAARIALGLGAQVTILDISAKRLSILEEVFGNQIQTLMSNPFNIEASVKEADVVIGAVLLPGAKAPKLVTENMVKQMRPGSVIVDVAVDQGGVVETANHVTTHEQPVYEKYGVLHYAVANIPGAVARTSTIALTNVTLPYIIKLANQGFKKTMLEDAGFCQGVTTYKGYITNPAVAAGLQKSYTNVKELL
ncbi:alanine dehydrogenase [Streptococcus azizii]|uniref:Alanine dehydrogenase n=1 Tax=Streptococcus azizii TaxID=1579424 RepID=A0AB36JTY2_9STRE|nr:MULTISPECIES: alanine dehydrogenase [Streptococcus]MBF0775464.1 alanine dehydrogenase [Streptococcus sp. 19428wD3_AN2]ONK28339.1 alanine dehydrogenase [Streptococcus azizii]ONK28965.1 alanine dehydrogenase [Streptococcus azizii]ONK30210.1 alanine dehydrogenase [Streptococcus azizii]TFU84629.1 alanine dehydrogenase [Streptococcus sp. AN2]